ncbi:MAG: HAD hydrolase-like protein, partial [Oscillospiraceae bacterium]|nr:HAD hydrolase-like protein [Oscillospiraceae bacterium]
DGTVFDTVEGITKSVQYAARRQGLDPELKELRRFAGPPLVDMFMEHFGFDQPMAEQATRDFRERYNPIGLYECRVFPGVKDALLELRRRGYLVGIATSKPQVLAEELLGREDMLSLFDGIVGSRADGNNNSKAEVLRAVMEKLSVMPEETVLVGDTKYDVYGAKACGVPCIGVGWGYAAEGELKAAGADGIVPDLEALLALFPDRNPG